MFGVRTLTLAFTMVLCAHLGCSGQPDAAPKGNRAVAPGSHGEPPPEILEFVPPIELVAASGYSDGGTLYVHLRDSRGTSLVLCVYQDAFEDEIPANALFIGATHPRDSSARLPLSENEAQLAIESLRSALASLKPAKASVPPDTLPSIEEQAGDDQISNDQTPGFGRDQPLPQSDREFVVAFAESALRQLDSQKNHPLADRAELAARTARLKSVDLNEAAAAFRAKAGEDRHAEWDRLEPVLNADSHNVPPGDLREYFEELLGPPDPALLKRFDSMIVSPVGSMTPIQDNALAYGLGGDDGVYALIVDFRDPSGTNFSILFGSR